MGDMLEYAFRDMNIVKGRDFLLERDPLVDHRILTSLDFHSTATSCYGTGALGTKCPVVHVEMVSQKAMALDDDHDLGIAVKR